jgi:hypothetical protein
VTLFLPQAVRSWSRKLRKRKQEQQSAAEQRKRRARMTPDLMEGTRRMQAVAQAAQARSPAGARRLAHRHAGRGGHHPAASCTWKTCM